MAGRDKIPALTGIRGVAAVWVVLFHFCPWAAQMSNTAMPNILIPYGYLGVDLFFLLSGFVLGKSYAKAIIVSPYSSLVRFGVGRAFRVLPLHWFMLSVLGAIVLLWPSQMSAPDRTLPSFIACFFLVQTWGLGYPMAWNWPTLRC